LLFSKEPISFRTFERSPQNIYITSDEEIKDERLRWIIDNREGMNGFIHQVSVILDSKICPEIILTTDQDLIKDGVQPINDEFLDWFVKNPSCESVEVNDWLDTNGNIAWGGDKRYQICNHLYDKIIIPQEEPKQNCENCKQPISKYGCACGIGKEEPKQETLEEAAERYYGYRKSDMFSCFELDCKQEGFIEGAKWQAKRSYNKAIEFAEWIRIKDFQTASKNNWIGLDMKYYTTEELFEQFKKK
jgi:hypothetical protein